MSVSACGRSRGLRYRGKYRGPLLNFGPAVALNRAAQLLKSEVSVAGCHAYHGGRTPADNLCDLRNRNASIKHPRDRSVAQIVETAGERLSFLFLGLQCGTLFVRLSFSVAVVTLGDALEDSRRAQLGSFPWTCPQK